jgi:glutamate carboxypeptidase
VSKAVNRAREILAYLEDQVDAMVEMLVDLASHESPSDVPESQVGVQSQLTDVLQELDFRIRHVPGRKTGGHLFAVPINRDRDMPVQLLVGHTDTVWPLGTTDSMPVVIENGIVRGPGTFDMKGGIVQAIFALRAIRSLGFEFPATPIWFINSDEEIGSPESQRYIRMISQAAVRAFILEPGLGAEGKLKTARKGVGRFRILIHGEAAHSGLDPTRGASAIQELANVVHQLHSLTDLERGITVNVGVVQGGTRVNVKAAEAEAEVDVRVASLDDGEAVAHAIRGLTPRTPGTSLEVLGGIQAPPLERTPRNLRLWEAARAAGNRLGIELEEGTSGGASDGNTTSQYAATLDGLGSLGDGAHALHEHVVAKALPSRAALLAELLLSPVNSGDEW